VDTFDGTEKGTETVKCQLELHSQESLEHLIWNVCTALCNVACLLNWEKCEKLVGRNVSHEMSQATDQ
jgi:hypothetical protein